MHIFPLDFTPLYKEKKNVIDYRIKCSVRYNKINITFPERVIVEDIFPRKKIINLGFASVDNHIPQDDNFDFHPLRECNLYII